MSDPCKHASLVELKETIKVKIMQPLHWKERMDLYEKVRCINLEIESCPRKCLIQHKK